MTVASFFLVLGLGAAVYAYVIYPALLYLLALRKPRSGKRESFSDWPRVSITVPAYNEGETIEHTLDSLLALDYSRDKLQILVVSDASTDGTDDIVASYADRGVELLRLAERSGKTAAENAARSHVTGEIVVNLDASIRVPPGSLKPLIAAFADPTVGVASGRDISVARADDSASLGEAGYVGYEMWVRDLETSVEGIIGASGCFFASRADLNRKELPDELSCDFAAPLVARENGYRSVSVPDAVCYVPRTSSLGREYRRKLRTITRGMQTLIFKRHLLNPFRYAAFSWMLFSHKISRWLVPWLLLPAAAAIAVLSISAPWARFVIGAILLFALLGLVGWVWPRDRRMPRLFSLPAFAIGGNLAAMHAAVSALKGDPHPIWEPTRRETADVG